MSTRHKVSGSAEWRAILKSKFDIRPPQEVRSARHYSMHYHVRAGCGQYILSCVPKTPNMPPFSLQFEIIRALRNAGVETVRPAVPAVNGDLYVSLRENHWYLRAYVPHDRSPDWHDKRLVSSAARALGRLHEAGADPCAAEQRVREVRATEVMSPFNWSVHQVMERFDEVLGRFDAAGLRLWERAEVLRRANDLKDQAEPALAAGERAGLIGLTHEDYRPANLLARGREVIQVVDWDRARRDHQLYDVALGALQYFVQPCGGCRSDFPLAALFIRTYLEARPGAAVPSGAHNALPWMLRFAIIRRMLVNGRTRERFRLLRNVEASGLLDPKAWGSYVRGI